MKTFDKWTASLAVMAASALTFAQGGPPGGQPQGPPPPGGPGGQFGPGPGGPGMMRGGMMMGGGPQILRRPEVQKELKLTPEQIEKLMPILGGPGFGPPPPGGAAPRGGQPQGPPPPGGFQGGPPQGGPGQGGPGGGFQRGPGGPGQGGPGFGGPQGPGGQDRVQQLEKQIKTILTDSQFDRYQQLALQFEGPHALMRKDVADKAGLSDEKRRQIAEILRGSMGGMIPQRGPGGPGFGGPGQGVPPPGGAGPGQQRQGPPQGGQPGGDFEQMRQQMEKRRKDTAAKILAVLSSEERSKWNALLGKEFKFETLGPPRGGV